MSRAAQLLTLAAVGLLAGCHSSADKRPSPSPSPTATYATIPGLDEPTLRARAMQELGVTKPLRQDTKVDGKGRRRVFVDLYNRQRKTNIGYSYLPDTAKVIGVLCKDPRAKTTSAVTPIIAVCA